MGEFVRTLRSGEQQHPVGNRFGRFWTVGALGIFGMQVYGLCSVWSCGGGSKFLTPSLARSDSKHNQRCGSIGTPDFGLSLPATFHGLS